MPPFVGVAVNVSDEPEQAGFVPDVNAMETEGVSDALTVIVITFDEIFAGLELSEKIMFGLTEPVLLVDALVLVQAPAPPVPLAL